MDRFIIKGNIIALCRYALKYSENGKINTVYCVDGNDVERQKEYLTAMRNASDFDVTELDISDIEWLDGIEAVSYEEAVKICEMGAEAYKK